MYVVCIILKCWVASSASCAFHHVHSFFIFKASDSYESLYYVWLRLIKSVVQEFGGSFFQHILPRLCRECLFQIIANRRPTSDFFFWRGRGDRRLRCIDQQRWSDSSTLGQWRTWKSWVLGKRISRAFLFCVRSSSESPTLVLPIKFLLSGQMQNELWQLYLGTWAGRSKHETRSLSWLLWRTEEQQNCPHVPMASYLGRKCMNKYCRRNSE